MSENTEINDNSIKQANIGRHRSWIITVVICSVLIFCLCWLGWKSTHTPEQARLFLALCALVALIGWLSGMVMSPDSDDEAHNFTMVLKSITLFISGYLVSKIDPLITEQLKRLEGISHVSMTTITIVTCLAGVYISSFLIVYIVRIYALGTGIKKRDRT